MFEGATIRRRLGKVNNYILTFHNSTCIVRFVPRKTEKSDESVIVTFEAPRELVERLDDAAEGDRRSRSFVIRELLLRALAQNEKTA